MDSPIEISPQDYEIIDKEFAQDVSTCFGDVPDIAKPLMQSAKAAFSKIEQLLYSAPALINAVKASIPDVRLQAVLTDEQNAQLARGTLKLMRVAPIGLFFHRDPMRAATVAADAAAVTHGHPSGFISAALFAFVIA